MEIQQREEANYVIQSFILPAFLFVVGLLPRLLTLNVLLTPDEARWLDRSRDFLVGILSRDWAATLQTGHPGVTTMWTGALGVLYRYLTRPTSMPDDLISFVHQVSTDPLDMTYIVPMRSPTVLLTSLFVVVFYFLVSRLTDDWRVGAFAALLLALDPFLIGLSRVLHHDALATTFMTLAMLSLLGYWLKGWSRWWLLFSAVAAGLSFLSKSPALFLMPFCAILGLAWGVQRWRRGEWQGWSDVGGLLTDGLLWGGVAWLIVLLLWPAMWVTPLKVLGVVFGTSSLYATEGHVKGNFFLGQIRQDPGSLFYPFTWLFRSTPLAILGLLALASVYVRSAFRRPLRRRSPDTTIVGALLLFAGLFVAFMTLGSKKMDRYILPIYPALYTLAALGLANISNIKFRIPKTKYQVRNLKIPIFLVIVVFQGILVTDNHPYYFTYYNPLLGGARTAVRVMTVGWGEGLDQVAVYLNRLPDPERLRVTSWYPDSLASLFRGKVISFDSDAGKTFRGDYAVVYRNQIQRELPTPELMHYLLQHHTPVFTVTLQGVEYVYVYDLPIERRSNWEASRLSGQAVFFGVGEVDLDGESEIEAGDSSLPVRVYWQNDGLAASERWWLSLQSVAGQMQPRQECHLRSDFANERFRAGAVLESECRLPGEKLSPGVYHLRVAVGPEAEQVKSIPFPEGEFAVVVSEDGMSRLVSKPAAMDVLARQRLPQGTYTADLVYQGAARLIGYRIETVSNGDEDSLYLRLIWQALQSVPLSELKQGLNLEVTLLSPQGMELATAKGLFAEPEGWPAVWSTGQVVTRTLALPLPRSVPPQSLLRLDVWLDEQQLIPLSSSGEVAEPLLPAIVTE